MTAMTSAKARKNFSQTIMKVCDDREAVIIEHGEHHRVVMIPLEEYESMNETEYLLRSPSNAQNLLEAVDQIRTGKATVQEIDLEA